LKKLFPYAKNVNGFYKKNKGYEHEKNIVFNDDVCRTHGFCI